MAKLLFKLRDVPLDEAQDIRELLNQNEIDFYETHAGNWGIAMAAIWLKDENQYPEAVLLIDEYQQQRAQQFQNDYAELKRSGHAPTLLTNIRESPLRFVVYLFSIAVILYISVMPFLGL